MERMKRAVIKEELVELTGDYKLSIVLNQLIYWTEFVRDFDAFMEEERQRRNDPELPLTEGWIYKSAEELATETMMKVSPKTMREYIKELVAKGWVEERRNPHFSWDHTKQYRVNLYQLQQDLYELGYVLQGYKLFIPFLLEDELETKRSQEDSITPEQESIMDLLSGKNVSGEVENDGTIPKITNKIIHKKDIVEEIVAYLNEKTEKNFQANSRKTKDLISARLNDGFEIEDFKKVIDTKCKDWQQDPQMNKYLRPETLFGTKFEAYLNERFTLGEEVDFESYLKGL